MGKSKRPYGAAAIERWFNTMLKRHISEGNWVEVEADFAWYGRFLETIEAQR